MSTNALPLAGRNALVTGSTSGLGAGIAVALAEAGATRHRHRADPVPRRGRRRAHRIHRLPSGFHSVDFAEGAEAIAELVAAAGEIDILVNNVATLVQPSPTADVTADEIAPLLARIPSHRMSTVAEVAATVVFLAGPQAGNVHGAILSVDGGLMTV
jgi:NAD(P)-dependent dehydrogenase (short-subunit alcohol dehydrogenase family)